MAPRNSQTQPDPLEDDFDRELDGYEAAYEDSGYKIELAEGDSFKGRFNGTQGYMAEDRFNPGGPKQDVTMLLFTDEQGKKCNMWANYSLTQALESGKLVAGKDVMIRFDGKTDIKDGTQQLSKYSVYVKK